MNGSGLSAWVRSRSLHTAAAGAQAHLLCYRSRRGLGAPRRSYVRQKPGSGSGRRLHTSLSYARPSPAFVAHAAPSPPSHHRYTPSPAKTRERSARLTTAGRSSRGSYARTVTGPAESPIAYTAPRPMIAPSRVPYIEPRPHSCPCHAGHAVVITPGIGIGEPAVPPKRG